MYFNLLLIISAPVKKIIIKTTTTKNKYTFFKLSFHVYSEALLGVFGIREIRRNNYRDTGYLRKTLLGYRILRSSFRDTGYSQKIVTYQMFDEKRSWITKYMPFSVLLSMNRYQ